MRRIPSYPSHLYITQSDISGSVFWPKNKNENLMVDNFVIFILFSDQHNVLGLLESNVIWYRKSCTDCLTSVYYFVLGGFY